MFVDIPFHFNRNTPSLPLIARVTGTGTDDAVSISAGAFPAVFAVRCVAVLVLCRLGLESSSAICVGRDSEGGIRGRSFSPAGVLVVDAGDRGDTGVNPRCG